MENFCSKWSVTFIFLIILLTSIHFIYTQLFIHLSINFDNIKLKKSPPLPLRFNSDGTFKILQVADMHFGQGLITKCKGVSPSEFKYCSDLNTTKFVQRLIEVEKPDFLAFTGDNIFGSSTPDAAESLFKAFKPAVESRLPWAAVLGNHDQESTMNREELMSLISLMDYSVSQVNPSSGHQERDELTGIDGFGNYNLSVHGPYGSLLANLSVLNLLFLDSGDRAIVEGRRTYGWIRESQLNWLKGFSQTEQDEHGECNHCRGSPSSSLSRVTPLALGFFHIPIPEIRQLYYQKVIGHIGESVACSSVNSGVLKSLVSMKNVKGVFIGHDHNNDCCGNLDGIWFCYGGGSGYHGYGKVGWDRRARVVQVELSKRENSWIGLEKISTWKRLDDKLLSKIDEQVLWDQNS
ncbi:probable inactive purple acid phosphatase 28 [Chenopodium quinoa]|uniref:Calcineurin-like phosphoesterase domain-containing protein n=1 Tax=Chenopodium quinoa TaxID=63459 RepID=A0A803MD73_CHEQI|nr:probable inactive purple acid phosphatase 28 [Chenopodium quinoa]XP_021751162.1 probable inactive purple acid phosphatase 28 [Chenopodium quinoa]